MKQKILGFVVIFELLANPLLVLADEVVSEASSSVVSQSAAAPVSENSLSSDASVPPSEGVPASGDTVTPSSPSVPNEVLTDDTLTDKSDKTVSAKTVGEEKNLSAMAMSSSMETGGGTTGRVDMVTDRQLPKTDEVTGALTYEYPISVPQGRNGMNPDLSLRYNSQNKENSIYGYGWSDSIPFIERVNKKGTDTIFANNYFSSSLDGELALVSGNVYRAKVENGNFNSYVFENNGWTVTTKTGNVYKFGNTAVARQDDPSDGAKVYRWMIEEVRDLNGNGVNYSYYKDAGQIYPATISYTNNGTIPGIYGVEFLREDRNDIASSGSANFLVYTKQRIKEIVVRANGSVIYRHVLSYIAGDNGRRSLLSSVQESGTNESGTVTLPAVQFGYSASAATWTENTDPNKWRLPGGHYFVHPGGDNGGRLIDFNGNSLSDLIWQMNSSYSPNFQARYDSYINTGSTWATTTVAYPSPEPFLVPYDMGLRLGDVNGDGYIDEVVFRTLPTNPRTEYKAVHLGSPTGWVGTANWVPVVPFVEIYDGYSSQNSSTCLVDVNGDGLSDITGNRGTNINNGTQFVYDANWTFPIQLSRPTTDMGVRVVDVNGDDLPDVVVARSIIGNDASVGKHVTYLNTGHGWQETSDFVPPRDFFNRASDEGTRLADVNGDNLIDFIGNGGVIYKNTGSGWVQAPSTFPTEINKYIDVNLPREDLGVSIDDVNGDGLPDVIKNRQWLQTTYQVEQKVWLKDGVRTDLLTSVTNEKGATTRTEYAHTAQFTTSGTQPNPTLQFNVDVVKNMIIDPGLGGSISTASYLYSDGSYYHDDIFDRKFAGFGKITKTDEKGNVTKSYYHQGNASDTANGEYADDISKIRRPYRIEQYDTAGNLYTLTVNKWDSADLGSGAKFVKLARTTVSDYDGNATHKDVAIEYGYNNTNGNVTFKGQSGEVVANNDGSFTDIGTDKIYTWYDYAKNASNPALSLPYTEYAADQNYVMLKDVKWYYDGLPFGSFDKGNRTKEEKRKENGEYAASQKTYDNFGNVLTSTDPRGNVTTYHYDAYNMYPDIVTNALGQTKSFIYDYASGKAKQTTDENGLLFTVSYDGLGRPLLETQPDPANPQTLVTKTSYFYIDTPLASSAHRTNYLDGTLSVDQYEYKDGLDRTIQTRNFAEDGQFAVKDYIYDFKGLLQKESLPYFSSGSARTSPTANSALYSVYAYDPRDRVKQISNVVGTTSNSYDDWKVVVTDARGKTKTLSKDAYGNLVKVEETNLGATYATNYAYDLLGDLTKITDAEGNVRNFTYDYLGNRLTAEDLHSPSDTTFGTWRYFYDVAGNLFQKIDPKNQAINYEYDALNRVKTEDSSGTLYVDVTYAYDTCANGKTRLCSSNMVNSAVTALAYDPLGRVSSETKTIAAKNYVTSYAYDRQGNKTLITYPDNSQVRYTANTAGLTEKVEKKENGEAQFSDVVSAMHYSPLGAPSFIQYANGVSTTNFYDQNGLYRLKNKTTVLSDNMRVQDISYTYDPLGNILTETDASATKAKKDLVYTYDDLSRLLTATATNSADNTNYTQTYSYSPTGNITNGPLGAYVYAGNTGTNYANPHAATSVGGKEHVYDNAGDLLKDGFLTNTWDYRNRLASSGMGTATSTYAYDANDNRVRLVEKGITTYFPNDLYSVASGGAATTTKNIFVGDLLVATHETSVSNTIPLTYATSTIAFGSVAKSILSTPTTAPTVRNWTHSVSGTAPLLILYTDLQTTSTLGASTTAATFGGIPLTRAGTVSVPFSFITAPTTYATSTITFGNVSKAISGTRTYVSSSKMWSHIVSGTNPLLVVYADIQASDTVGATVSSITYNGIPLVFAGAASWNGEAPTYGMRSEIWYLANPPVGTKTISVKVIGGAKSYKLSAATFRGVSPNNPLDTIVSASGTSGTPTASLTTALGGELVTSTANINTTSVITSPKTLIWSDRTASNFSGVSYQLVPASGSYSNAYTGTTNAKWTELIASFKPNVTITPGPIKPINGVTSEIWYLKNPPAGSKTVSVSVSGKTASIKLASAVFTGVSTTTDPLDTVVSAFETSGIPTASLTTALSGELVTANASVNATTAATNRTSIWKDVTANNASAGSYQFASTTGSYSDTYTGTTTVKWAELISAWKPNVTTKAGTPITATSSSLLYVHTDHLGGANVITDKNGAVVETLDYYPYGEVRLDEKTGNYNGSKRKYIGEEYDSATGLSYLNARYYNGKEGRFLSEDPVFLGNPLQQNLLDPQSLNSYNYANGNPIVKKDPSGRCADLCIGEVTAMAYLAAMYAPQISVFAQSLMTPLGQYGMSQAADDAGKGNYGWAVVGAVTSGDISGGKVALQAAKNDAIAGVYQPLSKYVGEQAFSSYSSFKNAMGTAKETIGEGYEWHHIIEQKNVAQLGQEVIQNTKNIVGLPRNIHMEVSKAYSSIVSGTTQTFRSMVSTQSALGQLQAGLNVLKTVLSKIK